jgi:hypothetical protein
MALLGADGLRAIDQAAGPNARATSGPVVEQTKPLNQRFQAGNKGLRVWGLEKASRREPTFNAVLVLHKSAGLHPKSVCENLCIGYF